MPDVSGWNHTSQPRCGQHHQAEGSTRTRVQPKNRMRENRTSGTVPGAPGDWRPYGERALHHRNIIHMFLVTEEHT